MKLKRLIFKINKIIILIFLSGFFIMPRISWANDGDIVIKDVMYNPKNVDNKNGSYEWVKIKNLTKEKINIKNWDIRVGKFYKPFELLDDLPGEGEVFIYLGIGNNENIDFKNGNKASIYLNETLSKLGDSAGEVVLYDSNIHNENTLRDYVAYGEINNNSSYYKQATNKKIWLNGCFLENVAEGEVLEVYKNNCRYFLLEEKLGDAEENYLSIRINEIYPNPKNEEDEFIELYNFGNKKINLAGWILKDANETKKYILKNGDVVESKDFLVVNKKNSEISLNNSGEEMVYLLNPNSDEVSKVAYFGAKENFSYGFSEKDNKWRWSEFLTPGVANLFREVEKNIINIDKDIYKNVYANFEVTLKGIKERELKAKWEFGDGKSSYQSKTRHKYIRNGKYLVKLTFFNGSEDVKKEFNIIVGDFPKKEVSILAINPNPKGKDVDGEWVELKNKSKKKVNLKNWSLATGLNKKKLVNHPISESFEIESGKIRQLTREYSKFSLNNKKGYIELRYPDGEIAYNLKYKKEEGIDENEIYKKKEGKWKWIKDTINIVPKNTKEDVLPEIKSISESVIKKSDDMELIRDITAQDIGKYSLRKRRNLINEQFDKKLNIQNERKQISLLEKQVLGAWDNKNKKIREVNGFYYFNPQVKEEKHYLIRFLGLVLNKL